MVALIGNVYDILLPSTILWRRRSSSKESTMRRSNIVIVLPLSGQGHRLFYIYLSLALAPLLPEPVMAEAELTPTPAIVSMCSTSDC